MKKAPANWRGPFLFSGTDVLPPYGRMGTRGPWGFREPEGRAVAELPTMDVKGR